MDPPLRCRYREAVEKDGDGEMACCRVLQEIVGLDDPGRFRVGRDACTACQQAVSPSPERINQVIASFLYTIAGEIIEQDGMPGCARPRAQMLQRWAKKHLEVHLPVAGDTGFRDGAHSTCRHLGERIGQRVEPRTEGHRRTTVFHCLRGEHEATTEEECLRCRDWANLPAQVRPLAEIFGAPVESGNRTVKRWAVGVTTAPRRESTLEACLDYLSRAGWDGVRLFVDERTASPGPRHRHLPTTLRQPSVGAWPNYYLGLQELLLRHPEADALMIVQDDACFYDRECLREYVERVLWPVHPPGIISLYCSSAYTNQRAGWHEMSGQWVWGALAFVFPRERAIQFVTDPGVIAHRWKTGGLKLIDEAIGKWALRENVPIHFPCPSLVQHMGATSTLWPGVPSAGYRRADWFAGRLNAE